MCMRNLSSRLQCRAPHSPTQGRRKKLKPTATKKPQTPYPSNITAPTTFLLFPTLNNVPLRLRPSILKSIQYRNILLHGKDIPKSTVASQQTYSLREKKKTIFLEQYCHKRKKRPPNETKSLKCMHSFSSKIILMCGVLGSLKSDAGGDATKSSSFSEIIMLQ